jgi:hypothetical protein
MSTNYVNKFKLLFVSYNWHKNQKGLGINT